MKKILALVGKAGAGKDTVMKELVARHPQLNCIVSCTTRTPRQGEKDGEAYYFLTHREFTDKVLSGDMLEATEFNGWFYGTAKSALAEGWNIGVFNPEGFQCLCETYGSNVVGVYIAAKDKTRMLRQLNREDNPDVREIVRRFSADWEDFMGIEDYIDFIVPNESTLDEAVRRIEDLGIFN